MKTMTMGSNMEYKTEVNGQGCIVARVVAHSVTEFGKQIITFELEYPRFIHGEFMTHRQFSRNAMSSRAVPIEKMMEQVRNNPAMPIHWGKNQAGMQAKEELKGEDLRNAMTQWKQAALYAAGQSEILNTCGAHKQIVNRILEPFQVMKTVMTTTEIDNFFYLRCHEDAQPEIKELADCMKLAMEKSVPELLKNREWHTPYVQHKRKITEDGLFEYLEYSSNDTVLSEEDALKVSASCCAQVSFRLCDDSVDKAKRIYERLVESKPVHASPFEHQARPMSSRFKDTWSGNFQGWIQHRQLIKNHVFNRD